MVSFEEFGRIRDEILPLLGPFYEEWQGISIVTVRETDEIVIRLTKRECSWLRRLAYRIGILKLPTHPERIGDYRVVSEVRQPARLL
jgi:hypothetical protein